MGLAQLELAVPSTGDEPNHIYFTKCTARKTHVNVSLFLIF